ncbi:MAG: DUF1284 domain-containing protein [Candidatus Woesearchaeota archaeon]|nr:MAG: DUF1284 domain-containing protein [Candidatus Woesearchaeota archaeon]
MNFEKFYQGIMDIRAHHVYSTLFKRFIDTGTLASRVGNASIIIYPIKITDKPDIICGYCKQFTPAVNFCSGEKNKKIDYRAAEELGLVIGEIYSQSELEAIFKKEVKKKRITEEKFQQILIDRIINGKNGQRYSR